MRPHVSIVVFASLILPVPAFGWHKDGHMAIARIAWSQLDGNEQAAFTKILKDHPHYDLFLKANLPNPTQDIQLTVDEWAFARAAAWPDWVRDAKEQTPTLMSHESAQIKEKYHHGSWHFVNLPFIHPSDAATFDDRMLANLTSKALEPETDDKGSPRHAIAALKQNLKILRNAETQPADRAVALCWVLHLIGDIHQPLHASALIAKASSLPKTEFKPAPSFDPPEGDAGGNRLAIRLKEADINADIFHSYWDGLVFKDTPQFIGAKGKGVEAQVRGLLGDPALKPENFPELKAKKEFLDWAKESLEIAKNVAYREKGTADSGFLAATPLPSGLDQVQMKSALHNLKAKVLSAEYQVAATAAATKRIMLAGYRLGQTLKN